MSQAVNGKRLQSPSSESVSLDLSGDIKPPKRKTLKLPLKRTKTPSIADSLDSFNPELLESQGSPLQSSTSVDNALPEDVELFDENKYASSIFCMHFVICVVSTAAILVALYQETLKFLIMGKYIFYICIGAGMGLVYMMMLLRQLFRNNVNILQRKSEVWDLLFLTLIGLTQAVLLATVSAYHDTEIPLFAIVTIGTVYWITALSAALKQSSIVGWRMYVIAISVISIIFMLETFLLCFHIHCASLQHIALATAIASAVSLHTVYAAHMILRKKWQSLNPKGKTNAPILVYIFIPIVILHALSKCIKQK